LQEFATRDGVDGSQFWDFTWDQTLYNDETYGLPFETDVYVLYYNKNAFREAGLDPEKPPTTWAEAEEYAAKLDKKAADGSFERIGFFPLQGAGGNIWGYTNGVQWVQDGQPMVNSEQAVETYDWIKASVDKYGGWQNIQNFRAGFAAPPNDAFMSGKMAMVVNTAGYQQTLNFFRPQVKNAEGENEALEWGVAQLPYNADAAPATWSGGFALSIPRGADNPEAAWEFIKCAAGPDGATSWSRDTYAIPAYQPAMSDPALTADPAWGIFTEAMNTTNSDVFVPEYPTYFQQVNQREEQIWTGALTPQEGLNQAQQAIEQEVGQ
jgi:multiple sugar transport system substrate-binding protein